TYQQEQFKFPMHDVYMKKAITNVKIAVTLSALSALVFYFWNNESRKLAYRTFYSNYDPMDAFDRMRSGGYLDSCPKESKEDKDKDKKDK
ncbi:hypothetical protein KR222_002884, partial [Zaprionus bogoriensis]